MCPSKIEWTDETWNPITGCSRVSPGCDHCYARTMARRLQAMGSPRYAGGFDHVRCHDDLITQPLHWNRPRRIFLCSMSDPFQPQHVSTSFLYAILKTIRQTPQHRYLLLTKRPHHLDPSWWPVETPSNLWIGVTVESSDYYYRIRSLFNVSLPHRFLSLEPLLTPMPDLPLDEIDWVIVGGESGPGARPMHLAWVRAIRDHCIERNIPFFFKQWGGVNKKKAGRILDGRTWDQFPPALAPEKGE